MGGFIGQDVPRVEGPAKVTGSARYSGEITPPDLAYAQIIGARVASGRITSIDATRPGSDWICARLSGDAWKYERTRGRSDFALPT